jgi:hypothetical protein
MWFHWQPLQLESVDLAGLLLYGEFIMAGVWWCSLCHTNVACPLPLWMQAWFLFGGCYRVHEGSPQACSLARMGRGCGFCTVL